MTSTNRLLTTIGYRLDGRMTHALEGSIVIAGAVEQWLRDGLGLIRTAEQTHWLAGQRAGICGGADAFARGWAPDRRFAPAMDDATRAAHRGRWQRAIAATPAF